MNFAINIVVDNHVEGYSFAFYRIWRLSPKTETERPSNLFTCTWNLICKSHTINLAFLHSRIIFVVVLITVKVNNCFFLSLITFVTVAARAELNK